jgi:HD-GYP domain-containing protein (c-di-GMP phosphodiesterase class II)
VALGRRVGLSKIQLLELGLAALMHDIGKSRLPIEVLNKHGRLEGNELRIVQSHSWRGVLALLAMQGSASRSWRAMVVAHEHHMKVDLSGYPRCVRPRRLSLFSRIVAIADGFDAATSLRVYQENPWTPADVVRGMRDNPKLGLDPVLVKAFINLTGIYPVGTVVTLDTHEIAVVMAAGTEASALARPGVRIVFDAMGNRLEDGPVVDLTAKGVDGQFVRSIIRTEDPDRHGIRVSDYFA